MDYRLYLVTDPRIGQPRPIVETVARAIDGGVTAVQLRDKTASDAEVESLARRLDDLCRDNDVTFFLNDRVAVAATIGCNVHVGQSDMSVDAVRTMLGDDALIGLSVGTPTELAQAQAVPGHGPDVLGIGPVFSTATKDDAPPGRGVRDTTELARAARAAGYAAVAIGGVNAATLPGLVDPAWSGYCTVSAIMGAPDPRRAAEELRRVIDAAPDSFAEHGQEER